METLFLLVYILFAIPVFVVVARKTLLDLARQHPGRADYPDLFLSGLLALTAAMIWPVILFIWIFIMLTKLVTVGVVKDSAIEDPKKV
jgi:uncharacterized membrane protein